MNDRMQGFPDHSEPLETSHQSRVARQAASYRRAVLPHLEQRQPYAIVGFPDHNNSGDSAIYLGEVKLFDEIGGHLTYVCSKTSYAGDIGEHHPEGPIFIHGGGNFGDLYSENGLRLKVLQRYRGRRIIQLPQTIHFRKQEALDRMAKAIADHGDFHLMVRDTASLDFAREKFDCPVDLVPDAAYYLERLAPIRQPARDVVTVQRLDEEGASGDMSACLQSLGPVRDWAGWAAPWSHYFWVVRKIARNRLTSQPAREASDMHFRTDAYMKRARHRLRVAVDVLSEARVIVSDRLHAHIISSLMRKPHVALDNSYGKISGYVETWGNDGLALRASNPDDLRAAVRGLLSGEPIPEETGYGWAMRVK